MSAGLWELARAKVNLTLHVGARQDDGYHPLDSLVVFADIGDELEFKPTEKKTSLTIKGLEELNVDAQNSVLRAMTFVSAPPHQIQLTKNLPVSSGIGGGSADAAAVLRKFPASFSHDEYAFGLGTDVPICLHSKTCRMTGIGEDISFLPNLGQLSAVLVNPRVAVSTREIFEQFDAVPRALEPRPNAETGDLLSRALSGDNDLQDVAISKAPAIADVLRALAQQSGCELARMSGSGATCFGIFRSDAQAKAAAELILAAQPTWWVAPCRLGDLPEDLPS